MSALWRPPKPWNPIIANVFYRAGVIERWGAGTLNIIDWCKDTILRPLLEAGVLEMTICTGPASLGRANPARSATVHYEPVAAPNKELHRSRQRDRALASSVTPRGDTHTAPARVDCRPGPEDGHETGKRNDFGGICEYDQRLRCDRQCPEALVTRPGLERR